jgi:SWI/SNF-related matrix-associated actin-dependent regulator of chromatin subfamily A member 5
MAPKNTGL